MCVYSYKLITSLGLILLSIQNILVQGKIDYTDFVISEGQKIRNEKFKDHRKVIFVRSANAHTNFYLVELEKNGHEVFVRKESLNESSPIIVFRADAEIQYGYEEDVYIFLKKVPQEHRVYYVALAYIGTFPDIHVEWDTWICSKHKEKASYIEPERPNIVEKIICAIGKCNIEPSHCPIAEKRNIGEGDEPIEYEYSTLSPDIMKDADLVESDKQAAPGIQNRTLFEDDYDCNRFDWNLENVFKDKGPEFKNSKIKEFKSSNSDPQKNCPCPACKIMPESAKHNLLNRINYYSYRFYKSDIDEVENLTDTSEELEPANTDIIQNNNKSTSPLLPGSLRSSIRIKGRFSVKSPKFYESIFNSLNSYAYPIYNFIKVLPEGKKLHLIGGKLSTSWNGSSNSFKEIIQHTLKKLKLQCDNATLQLFVDLHNTHAITIPKNDTSIIISKTFRLIHEKKLHHEEFHTLLSAILVSMYGQSVAKDYHKDPLFPPKTSLEEPISRSMNILVNMLTDATQFAYLHANSHLIKLMKGFAITAKSILAAAVADSMILNENSPSLPISKTHEKIAVSLVEFLKYRSRLLSDPSKNPSKIFWEFYKNYNKILTKIIVCIPRTKLVPGYKK